MFKRMTCSQRSYFRFCHPAKAGKTLYAIILRMPPMKRIITTILALGLVCSLNCSVQAQQQLSAGASAAQAAAIESLQALEPRNMDEFMENALLFSKLWRNDLAQKNFAKVLEFNPKEEDLIRLHEMATRILPNYMDELEDSPDLQPSGSVLAEKIREALNNRYHSEEAVANAVKEYLAAEWNSDKSRESFSVLNRTADVAAASLLEAMHKEGASKDVKKKAATALAALDGSARGPLIAALDAGEPEFVGQCVTILGARKDSDVLPFIYGFTADQCADSVKKAAVATLKKRGATMYDANAAAKMLIQMSKRSLAGESFPENCIDDQADVWSWNDEKGKPVHTLYPIRLGQLLRAVRLARGAHSLLPDNKTVEKMYWTAEAEFLAAYPDIAREMMTSVSLDSITADKTSENIVKINSLLDFALQFKYASTAVSACQALGQLKSAEALASHGDVFSPLVCALNSPYPKVRWAACEAIMAINPQTPYLGSSELPKALSWFMLGEGRKKVLIVAPKSVDALTVGGFLPDGFEPIIATTGKQALGILQYEPEIYAVFYSMDLYSVPPAIFLEKIREIPVAADVPVAITANSNRFEEAKKVVNERPLCVWAPTPSNAADMDRVMSMLDALKPYPMPSPEQTITFADKAAKFGAVLAEQCYGEPNIALVTDKTEDASKKGPARHDIARSAENDVLRKMYDLAPLADAAQYQLAQNLTVEASLKLLQNIPTLDAQTQIIDYASNNINSVDNRKAAVKAFEYSVSQFGLLLTTPQLTKQYDLLDSEQNKSSQEILNSLLDVIEAPWNKDHKLHKMEVENSVNKDYGDQPNFKAL